MKPQDAPPPADPHCTRREIAQDATRTGTALAARETVGRFGSANAEYIKGYTGIDHEKGQKLAKGLAAIAKSKVHPDHAKANIKQQAGFSAEVAATSRDNAESIIAGSGLRSARSDDVAQYGPNHNVVDRVKVRGRQVVKGSPSQMKFVGNRDQLLKDIAQDDGRFARYRRTGIELPSEQYAGAAEHCRAQAVQLRTNAQHAEHHGKPEAAAKLRREADHYDQLARDVRDSGMTTDQAIFYREHPKIATALDMARTSHRAGVEGAGYGVAIGGCIALLQNLLAMAQGDQDVQGTVQAVAIDTVKAGALGYGAAFVGSAAKAAMQQSGKQAVRALAGTTVPTLAVSICLSLGSSARRYAIGEITEAQLLTEVGEKGAGMLSAGMLAALGQVAIPVPVVGAVVGGLIGYSLSSLFYQSALDAARGAQASRELLARTRAIEAAARTRIAAEQTALDTFFAHEMPALRQQTQRLFAAVDAGTGQADAMAVAINDFATLLGQRLALGSMAEFDSFMQSDQPLRL